MRKAVCLLLSAFVLGAVSVDLRSAFADERALDELADVRADTPETRAVIMRHAQKLAGSKWSATVGTVTVCGRAPRSGLEAEARRLDALVRRSVERVGKLGYQTPSDAPRFTVVRIEVGHDPEFVIPGTYGKTLLVRRVRRGRRRGSFAAPERTDGLPTERDVVAATDAARLYLSGAARGPLREHGVGSLHQVVVSHVMQWGGVHPDAPKWFAHGLAAWLEAQAHGADAPPGEDGTQSEAAPPGHVCGSYVAATPADVVLALDAIDAPSPGSSAFLRELVRRLAEGKDRLPHRIVALVKAEGDASARVKAAFDDDLATVIREVAGALGGSAGSCDAAGLQDCGICSGKGRIDLACPACEGLGAISCASCEGSEACYSPFCQDGWHYFESGEKERCKFCKSGKIKCKGCGGRGKYKCLVCRGSGKSRRPCLLCDEGRVPCAESAAGLAAMRAGEKKGVMCGWCTAPKIHSPCPMCYGTGTAACESCWGRTKRLCAGCWGTGRRVMVYSDGTKASSGKCPDCGGKGGTPCRACKTGKIECMACQGDGRMPRLATDCRACAGKMRLPSVDAVADRYRALERAATKEEQEAIAKMIERGVAFLFTCRHSDGSFVQRDLRRGTGKSSRAGAKRGPRAISNAKVLWTLSTVGITKQDPRIAKALAVLRSQAARIVSGEKPGVYTQEASLTLRALVGSGEDPQGDLVEGLVKRIVDAQGSDGNWHAMIDSKEKGDPFESLFAIESLWIAQRKGVKVPSRVWNRALRAGRAFFGSSGPASMRGKNEVSATSIASGTALVILAKAGSLGDKAGTFDYGELDEVVEGVAWLDRHFAIDRVPVYVNGARCGGKTTGGYSAYLYSIQRLAMLLDIEVLGGERWHVTGGRHLGEIQFDDGSFEETGSGRANGPVRTTTSAILFLVRATAPLTHHEGK